ncbi:MAG: c-type cytochrome, partial [Acidobacteriota bacterium]
AAPVDPAPVAALFAASLSSADTADVRKAIVLLGAADHAAARAVLQTVMLDEQRPEAIRRDAVRAIGATRGGETILLRMATNGTIPAVLKPAVATSLFASYTAATRDTAAKFLERPQALASGTASLPPVGELALRQGDPAAGKIVFQQICTACHRIDGQGVLFGPELSQVGSKLAKQSLFNKIMQPSSGVAFGYEGYILTLKNGDTAAGYIESQTPTQLTLKSVGGISNRYDLSDIVRREEMKESLMPAGLTSAMSEKQFVDLVEYLSSRKGR